MDRKTNLDLLRIVAMFMVYTIHFIYGGVYKNQPHGINYIFSYSLFSIAIVAVDLFVLLSGYFSCEANFIFIKKPIYWLLELEFIRILGYIVNLCVGKDVLTVKNVLLTIMPSNYFIFLFIGLYFLHPILNNALKGISDDKILKISLLLFLAFSVYPTLLDILGIGNYELSPIERCGTGSGYTIINFALLYWIGGMLRRKSISDRLDKVLTNRICFGSLILNTILLTIWVSINLLFGQDIVTHGYEYCNPLIIFNAVLFFLLFNRMSIPNNRYISDISKISLTMFLVQGYVINFLDLEKIVHGNIFFYLIQYVCYGMVSLIISYIVDYIWNIIQKKLETTIINRMNISL